MEVMESLKLRKGVEIQVMSIESLMEVSHLKASRENRNLFFLSEVKLIHLFSLALFSVIFSSTRARCIFFKFC